MLNSYADGSPVLRVMKPGDECEGSEYKAEAYPAFALKDSFVGSRSYWRDESTMSGRLMVTYTIF